MRVTGLILLLISLKAQTQMPYPGNSLFQPGAFGHYTILSDSIHPSKKWSVGLYSGIGAGLGFSPLGNAAFFPAQIGLQINRRLNNNLYAFAGAAVTPVYFNFNSAIGNIDHYKNFMNASGFSNNAFQLYQGIQAGLMYVNDSKTFSISGSIGVSNSIYPNYPSTRQYSQKSPLSGTIKQ